MIIHVPLVNILRFASANVLLCCLFIYFAAYLNGLWPISSVLCFPLWFVQIFKPSCVTSLTWGITVVSTRSSCIDHWWFHGFGPVFFHVFSPYTLLDLRFRVCFVLWLYFFLFRLRVSTPTRDTTVPAREVSITRTSTPSSQVWPLKHAVPSLPAKKKRH